MKNRITFKNTARESSMIHQRTVRLLICMGTLAFILFARLAYLEIIKVNDYRQQAMNNAVDQAPITPPRGFIYDRNGALLATNTPIQSLDITRAKAGNLKDLFKKLQTLLPSITDADVQKFYQHQNRYRSFQPETLIRNLSQEDIATFASNRWQFPGVNITPDFIRQYPMQGAVASVVGYVGRINQTELNQFNQQNYSGTTYVGQSGIEKFFEPQLHGQVGASKVQKDASGKTVAELSETPPIPGDNLYLSIDANLQKIAQDTFGDDPGAVVAIQPSTGQILVLYSAPSFDPNLLLSTDHMNDSYNVLLKADNKPLFNRAVHGLYSPGSTAKPFLALEYLNDNTITPDFTIIDKGYYQLPNSTHIFSNWNLKSSGKINLVQAITESNDTFFFTVANMAGITEMYQALHQFGFGQKTGVQLNEELPGSLPDPIEKRHNQWWWNHLRWWPGDTEVMGIGQGYLEVTPIQLASAVATMANRGVRYQPTLVYAIQKPNSTTALTPLPPIPLPPVTLKNDDDWSTVIEGMTDVITSPNGTGFRFGTHIPYTVAAKTGTAQVIREKPGTNEDTLPFNERDNGLFIAFAPIENPQIAIAVISEHTENAPIIARKIFDYYLCTTLHLKECPDNATTTSN